MKPLATQTRGNVVKKMFPYQMKVYYTRTWIDESKPLDEQVEQTESFLLGDVPCSVQSASSSLGAVLENEYIILSPCLDMSPKEDFNLPEGGTEYYRLEITMNGRICKAENSDVLSIDNLEVYKIGNFSIGCKIRVHITSDTWAW